MPVVVTFDLDAELHDLEDIDEIEGTMSSQMQEDKLMHSVLEGDKKTIEDGKLIQDAVNRGLGGFTPDLMFKNLVQNYSVAKQLYGERILRLATGYDPNYLEKNLRIPEFRKELRAALGRNIEHLKDAGFLDSNENISEKGIALATLVMYTEELDRIEPRGVQGERVHKKRAAYGESGEVRGWKSGDSFRDFSLRSTLHTALRRGHATVEVNDLRSRPRISRGSISIIYGLDASGSMRGDKLEVAKKSGIALAYKAVQKKDKVGLIVFGGEVRDTVEPTNDFRELLRNIAKVKASRETDFVGTIERAIQSFPRSSTTKHLVLLTDALPTVGKEPEQRTLQAVSEARSAGITVSVIGIQLDKEGKKLAEEMARLGEGRLYLAKQLDEVDKLVLQDYAAMDAQ
jgi:Mg-chelatase subunit ChlD